MNTFFFGYLPIKTKRILRSFLFLVLAALIIWLVVYSDTMRGRYFTDTDDTILLIIGYVILTTITSYIIEPFTRYKK